jgi:hypothetical protein
LVKQIKTAREGKSPGFDYTAPHRCIQNCRCVAAIQDFRQETMSTGMHVRGRGPGLRVTLRRKGRVREGELVISWF